MTTLTERLAELIAQHGSLPAVAAALDIHADFLRQLHSGEAADPTPWTLRKLGLRSVVKYELLEGA